MPKTYEYDELNKLYEKSQGKLEKKKGELAEKEADLVKLEKKLKEAEAERDKYKEKKDELKKELKEKTSSSSIPSDYDKQKEKAKKYKEYKKAFGGKGADDIKRELTNAKEENEKLEKKLAKKKKKLEELKNVSSNTTSKSVEVVDSVSLELYQDKITELNKEIKGKETEIEELKQQLEAKDREVFELTNKEGEKKDFGIAVAREAHTYIKDAAETGAEIGSKVFPVVGPAVGGFTGLGIASVGAAIHAGAYTAEKAAEHGEKIYNTTLGAGKELAEKTGDNIADVTKNISDNTANVATTAVDRGADVTIEVIKATDNAREGLKESQFKVCDDLKDGVSGVKDYALKTQSCAREFIENLFGTGKVTVENLKEKLVEKQEKIEELKEEVKKKDKKVEDLEEELKDVRKKLETSQERLFAQIEVKSK